MKFINEEDTGYVMSPEEAQEVARITLDHNKKVAQKQKEIQDLDNILVVAKSNIRKKYAAIEAQKTKLQAAQKSANAPTTAAAKTGYVDKAGNATDAQGNVVTKESYDNILKVKQIINEETFDTRYADSETIQDLKDYMDAENIPYIEDEDETTIDFDKSELDLEWKMQLYDLGLEELDTDVDAEDILDVEDEENPEEEQDVTDDEDTDITNIHNEIDEKKVFYVKVTDTAGDFTGKLYKLFDRDSSDWRSKLVQGTSKTFEKLNYSSDWDEFDIIAFLRENYDNAELLSENEFNEIIESSKKNNENINYHKIPTLNEWLNSL